MPGDLPPKPANPDKVVALFVHSPIAANPADIFPFGFLLGRNFTDGIGWFAFKPWSRRCPGQNRLSKGFVDGPALQNFAVLLGKASPNKSSTEYNMAKTPRNCLQYTLRPGQKGTKG